jgi:reactive intermediate/imine deaminase
MPNSVFSDSAPKPGGFYSQAVKAGPMLFISGQLPLDLEGKVNGVTPGQQTERTLQHIESIVRAAGGTIRDLVQLTVYITDVQHWPEVNAAYQSFLKDVPVPPARAVVPVKELHYGALVEIQAVAYLSGN